MVVLDTTVVKTAPPSAQRVPLFSNDNRHWVVSAYAVVLGSLLPLGGPTGDLFGRKSTFLWA
jgi:MFS family permease